MQWLSNLKLNFYLQCKNVSDVETETETEKLAHFEFNGSSTSQKSWDRGNKRLEK